MCTRLSTWEEQASSPPQCDHLHQHQRSYPGCNGNRFYEQSQAPQRHHPSLQEDGRRWGLYAQDWRQKEWDERRSRDLWWSHPDIPCRPQWGRGRSCRSQPCGRQRTTDGEGSERHTAALSWQSMRISSNSASVRVRIILAGEPAHI